MTEAQKEAIIKSAKDFFRTIIIPKHLTNLRNLKLSNFDINPFLINYLAAFLCGDTSPLSIAKALVYPRILGTSINTSFGQNTQIFISSLSEIIGNASGIDGIDIEFIDAIDGRRKYCQCKAGPNTINKDDVAKIVTEISEVEFEPDALELVCTKFNQFRQIVKFLNKAENVAEMNNLKTITLTVLEGILNEK